MRMTKNIKEFIEEEVTNRIKPKYEHERTLAEYQRNIEQEIQKEMLEAATKACDKVVDEALRKYDFLRDTRISHGFGSRVCVSYSYNFIIKDSNCTNSVHRYRTRMNEEISRVVKSIITEMELGGSKAELMALLSKVGQD